VYGIGPDKIPSLYQKNINIDSDEAIGIHWFGGHRLAKEFESCLTDENINTINNSLSNYIGKFLNDKKDNIILDRDEQKYLIYNHTTPGIIP
jgi:hypothetical protein